MHNAETEYNQSSNILKEFQNTWIFEKFIHLPHDIIAFFTGNQFGKNCDIAYSYVMRIFGNHPVPKRNVLYFECSRRDLDNPAPHGWFMLKDEDGNLFPHHEIGTFTKHTLPPDGKCPKCGEKIRIHQRKNRIFRFASENQPTERETTGVMGESKEIASSVYPELKKWLPDYLIKRDKYGKPMDITIRKPSLTILDPNAGKTFCGLEYTGGDIVVEFSSYNQAVAATAGKQRLSIWLDESAPFDFYQEQVPRLFAEDGDLIFTLTPAIGLAWEFDEIFEKAAVYIRTDSICEFLSTPSKRVDNIETTDSHHNIAVLQAATDDNPTLSPQKVNDMYRDMADPDGTAIPTRRYGIFKSATGRIFKDFNHKIHMINPDEYIFSQDSMSGWTHGRAIDYHDRNPWAIVWAAISPRDECFVWGEWYPSPEKWITEDICYEIAIRSKRINFTLNLIDPLSNKVQTNSGTSTLEDINRGFHKLKKEGICTGGYWKTWNTKGIVGRDEIKKRLANSVKCEKPFNNKRISRFGRETYLPTIWILNNCIETSRSLKHWRYEQWANNRQLITKDQKDTPQQKFSHFCTALEALFKENNFRAKRATAHREKEYRYFKGVA